MILKGKIKGVIIYASKCNGNKLRHPHENCVRNYNSSP
jgi:hypothetical protein